MSTKSLIKILKRDLGDISFGGFLRAARTIRDLSQKDMADFLGISKSSLCDIEKGRQIVSINLASKIAKNCGLSEELAIEAAIQDQLYKSGMKFEVKIKKRA